MKWISAAVQVACALALAIFLGAHGLGGGLAIAGFALVVKVCTWIEDTSELRTAKVIALLAQHDDVFSADEIAEHTGLKHVRSLLNVLENEGIVVHLIEQIDGQPVRQYMLSDDYLVEDDGEEDE